MYQPRQGYGDGQTEKGGGPVTQRQRFYVLQDEVAVQEVYLQTYSSYECQRRGYPLGQAVQVMSAPECGCEGKRDV